MQTRATQPNETGSAFLPMTTHDIESLTNAILVASQSLSEITSRPEMKDHAAARELAQLLRCSALSIAPFINELVTIGKRQANSENVSLRAVYNLQEELEYIRDTFAYEALAKNIEISIFVSEDVPVVFCDINSLRIHVLNNILSNALQHTPAGGKIAIRAENQDNQTLVIKVSDSGAGFPLGERERVFRRQIKQDPLRSTASGLGLFNAQQCVQAHNGKISIVDDPEFSGATFKIELPMHAGCIQKAPAKGTSPHFEPASPVTYDGVPL